MSDEFENCTLNRDWIWNGKEYLDILTWNIAIETAASKVKRLSLADREEIRKLKK